MIKIGFGPKVEYDPMDDRLCIRLTRDELRDLLDGMTVTIPSSSFDLPGEFENSGTAAISRSLMTNVDSIVIGGAFC